MICDDNETVHQTLQLYLKEAGFRVVSAYDGLAALEMLKTTKVDLVILDIMMPKLFGTEVCRQVRRTSDLPIILLSAKVDEADRIVGLELGADDYVTKPFSPREVVTRVRTVLRRTRPSTRNDNKILQLGKLRINTKAYDVFIDTKQIKMTPREVELLTFLVKHTGEVVSREQILNAVWGYDYYGDIRAVDTLLARVRGKIPEKMSGVSFRTIYGVGYMLEERHE
ncbi:MAG: response regulator transcription factor [Oscillospiraceae bacterium]|nr:response regulator transcription factor [Oscillospiraceae bacterium]